MPPKRKTAAKAAASTAEAEAAEHVETPEPSTVETVAEAPPAPAEAVTNEEEAAPAIVVAGTPTEMYAQLQVVVAQNPARINDHVGPLLELTRAAEDPSTPILLRVRFLEFIGKNVANLRDNGALKKIVTALVKIIGGEDNTPALLIAALQCFPGLGPVSMLDKSWEYLSREGADILMQVILDKDAFPETVRHAARKSLDALTSSAFRSVATKLIHWLSDDREGDEADQIQKERHLALNTLSRMAMARSMRAHWTDETQEYVLSLIYRVLGIVDAREFAQLARVAANLSTVGSKHGLPLLQAFVAENPLTSERNVEAVSVIGRFIHSWPKKADAEAVAEPVEFDLATPMEQAGLLSAGAIDGESRKCMLVARVTVLAARLATAEAADKLLPFITSTLLNLVGNDGSSLPENLTTLEAILFAAVAIATKKSAEMLQTLNDEAFNAAMTAVTAAAAAIEPELTFAIKKKQRDNAAGAADAEALACVHNIQVIAGSFAGKHIPMGDLKESWSGKARLPAVKRNRDRATGVLPPAPGTAAANDRSRFASGNGHHNANGSGRRQSGSGNQGNNQNRKRGHSSTRQPASKKQRTSSSSGGNRNGNNNNSQRRRRH